MNKAQDTLKRARSLEDKYVSLIQENIDNSGDP
jgi:hypothetical protein